jgi:hypothetical protein
MKSSAYVGHGSNLKLELIGWLRPLPRPVHKHTSVEIFFLLTNEIKFVSTNKIYTME